MRFLIYFFVFILQFHRSYPSQVIKLELEDAPLNKDTINQINGKGYECGDVFFSDDEADEVLSRCRTYVKSYLKEPQNYRGPLYSDAMSSEYLIWPIKKDQKISKIIRAGTFFIVFRRDGKEVIDVISKTSNNHFTKCIRRDNSQTELSVSISEETSGYQCGYKFINDNIIRESVFLAKRKLKKGKKYPTPYTGSLYPNSIGYLIWPIFFGKVLYKTGFGDAGPYYLVIGPHGDLIDVFIKGFKNNLLRCIRSRIPPEAMEGESFSILTEPPPRTGFQCGKYFFDIDSLNNAAKEAKSVVSFRIGKRYPMSYSGNPFNQLCLLWPILTDGKLYKKGMVGPYRVVLTLEYNVKSAIVVQGNKIVECERKTVSGRRSHDTSDYICIHKYIFNQKLVKAAEAGCHKINGGKKNLYPAKYEGPRFDRDGPYFTYPVVEEGEFIRAAGRHRVVININCEVVGAISEINPHPKTKFLERKYVKCHRIKNGPLPVNYFDNQNEVVSEKHLNY